MQGKKPFSVSVSFLPPEIVDWILKIPRRQIFFFTKLNRITKTVICFGRKILFKLYLPSLIESIRKIKRNSKTERKTLLPVLPLMEKTRRHKVQVNSQSIMIIWAEPDPREWCFLSGLTGTASFRALPKLDFKKRNLLQITWIKKRKAVSRLPQAAF